MILFSKIINLDTNEVEVGLGSNDDYYKSIGMVQQDIEQAYNGFWYLSGFAPAKPPLTHEEISEIRKQYRRDNIDDLTERRSRKQALGVWTDEDEATYISTAKAVEEYIAENLPYPTEVTSDDIKEEKPE